MMVNWSLFFDSMSLLNGKIPATHQWINDSFYIVSVIGILFISLLKKHLEMLCWLMSLSWHSNGIITWNIAFGYGCLKLKNGFFWPINILLNWPFLECCYFNCSSIIIRSCQNLFMSPLSINNRCKWINNTLRINCSTLRQRKICFSPVPILANWSKHKTTK